MKTLEEIQYELGTEQRRLAKVILLMRCGAMLGELFATTTPKQRLETIGYFALTLCQVSCNEGIVIPFDKATLDGVEIEPGEDFAIGVAIWMGRFFAVQASFTSSMAAGTLQDDEAHKAEYAQNVRNSVGNVLSYLDMLAKDMDPGSGLLALANAAHQGVL